MSHGLLVQQALGSSTVCKANFKNKSITVGKPTVITKLEIPSAGTSVPLSNPNLQLRPNFWVQSLSLEEITQIGATPQFSAKLYVGMSADSPNAKSKQNLQARTVKIPIQLMTDFDPAAPAATVKVQDCASGVLPVDNAGGTGGTGTGPSWLKKWPVNLYCNGTVFTVRSPGVYHGFGGGESTTRSTDFSFSPRTNMITNVDTGGSSLSPCGGTYNCCTKTMDQLKADGKAW